VEFYVYADPVRYRDPNVILNVYKYDLESNSDGDLIAQIIVPTPYITEYIPGAPRSDYTPVLYGWDFQNWPTTVILGRPILGHCCGMSLLSILSWRAHHELVYPEEIVGSIGEVPFRIIELVSDNYPVTISKKSVEDTIHRVSFNLLRCSPFEFKDFGRGTINSIKQDLAFGDAVYMIGIQDVSPEFGSGIDGHAVVISGYRETNDKVYFYGYDPNYDADEDLKWLQSPESEAYGFVRPIFTFYKKSNRLIYIPNHAWSKYKAYAYYS